MNPASKRSRILCVDDEPNILEGLCLVLRRRYDVVTAPGGLDALEAIGRGGPFEVVMTDMRMPGMDGAAFLKLARQAMPDAVRILLTGQTDLDSAIAAVNEGQIFRFLTKPCAPPALLAAIDAAMEQHRLITAERVLLEETLHGSIKALTDILAVASPMSFGRATRIKQHVTSIAVHLGMVDRWQVEVAAMLSQLGAVTLPPKTAERLFYGRPLSDDEERMVGKARGMTEQFLAHIPRLESVREILATYTTPVPVARRSTDATKCKVERAAAVLLAAVDFDTLETQGASPPLALDTMRGRAEHYDPEILLALAEAQRVQGGREQVRELPLSGLRVGMTVLEDLKTKSGTLLVARGYEITPEFLERVHNFNRGAVKEPVRVALAGTKEAR
jgi:CheY-like chemotaxis protein